MNQVILGKPVMLPSGRVVVPEKIIGGRYFCIYMQSNGELMHRYRDFRHAVDFSAEFLLKRAKPYRGEAR